MIFYNQFFYNNKWDKYCKSGILAMWDTIARIRDCSGKFVTESDSLQIVAPFTGNNDKLFNCPWTTVLRNELYYGK